MKPKQNVTLRVPIVNKGGVLKNVTISPVISNSLDEFPFIAENVNYGRYFERWESGGMAYVEYNFTVSYYATNGNKPVKFLATYYENGEPQQCAFSTYVYITNGYVAPIEKAETAMSVMVSGYKLFVNGAEGSGLMRRCNDTADTYKQRKEGYIAQKRCNAIACQFKRAYAYRWQQRCGVCEGDKSGRNS